jgi:4-hydroxy-3-methylbut-2-en-1-yl diphosphate reductase
MVVRKVIIAQPRGFCAGVEMAVETVERALRRHGPPVYVFHEIVHNRHVVEDLSRRGVRFVQSIDDVPSGAKLVFSAHGVSPMVWQKAKERQVETIIDATCPLVDKVHREVKKFAGQGYSVILVGHETHDEIVGTSGEAPDRVRIVGSVEEAQRIHIPDREKVVVLTQTTLSMDDTQEIINALRERFPRMATPSKDDICYATQNRQDAVKELVKYVNLLLVIGSANSENSNQLCKVARARGVPAYLINDYREIDPAWLEGIEHLGITSGASVPDGLVQEAASYFAAQGAEVSSVGFVEENIHFALPAEVTNIP